MQALVATVHEILDFQVQFLKEIERPVESETGFEEFNAIEQFQVSWFFSVKINSQTQMHLRIVKAPNENRIITFSLPHVSSSLFDWFENKSSKLLWCASTKTCQDDICFLYWELEITNSKA